MGTTLTGTTPQDTYDSLIKVTDNGPLSGTAKYLSDGLGNDSVLALSTAAVGIGTSSPTDTIGYGRALDIQSATGAAIYLRDSSSPTTQYGFLAYDGTDNGVKLQNANSSGFLRFDTNATERMRITSTGNVGIGTATPTAYSGYTTLAINSATSGGVLDFMVGGVRRGSIYNSDSGNALNIDSPTGTTINLLVNGGIRASVTQNGLTFNGDTAAANALDDYEEGTFTPTFVPASGAYGTLTYGTTNGKYTKIGNRVDFSLRVTITGYSAGTASGLLRVQGLPFTCVASYVGSVSMSLVDDFAANRYPIKGFVNDTTSYMLLRYMTAFNTNEGYVEATDITASSNIRISGTYFTA